MFTKRKKKLKKKKWKKQYFLVVVVADDDEVVVGVVYSSRLPNLCITSYFVVFVLCVFRSSSSFGYSFILFFLLLLFHYCYCCCCCFCCCCAHYVVCWFLCRGRCRRYFWCVSKSCVSLTFTVGLKFHITEKQEIKLRKKNPHTENN